MICQGDEDTVWNFASRHWSHHSSKRLSGLLPFLFLTLLSNVYEVVWVTKTPWECSSWSTVECFYSSLRCFLYIENIDILYYQKSLVCLHWWSICRHPAEANTQIRYLILIWNKIIYNIIKSLITNNPKSKTQILKLKHFKTFAENLFANKE